MKLLRIITMSVLAFALIGCGAHTVTTTEPTKETTAPKSDIKFFATLDGVDVYVPSCFPDMEKLEARPIRLSKKFFDLAMWDPETVEETWLVYHWIAYVDHIEILFYYVANNLDAKFIAGWEAENNRPVCGATVEYIRQEMNKLFEKEKKQEVNATGHNSSDRRDFEGLISFR